MAVPTITSASPSSAPTGGRTLVRIRGTGFQLPPAPPPMGATIAPPPNPSVQVLFGARRALDVRVLSPELLHVVTPIGNAGATTITVRNIDQAGAPIAGEVATSAFTFERPNLARKPTEDVTLLRVHKQVLLELRRQVLDNTVNTTHTDFDDTPSGANVAALPSVPGLVLSGPTLIENKQQRENRLRKVDGAILRPARTVDLEYTLIGIDNLQGPLLTLMSECTSFVHRNIELSIPADASVPDGPTIDYEMGFSDGGDFKTVGSPGNANVRAFQGVFRVCGIDIDDEHMAREQTFPITDISRAGTAGATVNAPSPVVWLGSNGGPAGVVVPDPIPQGPSVATVGLLDGVQQLPPPEEDDQ